MMNFLKNDEGVSPIVATLVLIVVAIIGAAAVAMILGNFSGSVSTQVDSSSNITNSVASPHTISIAGSTTIYPAEVLLAKAYHAANPLVTINIAQGGSDAGVNAVGMNLVDIGASSKPILAKDNAAAADVTAYAAKYPNLQETKVGGSAVVVIVNSATITSVQKADLQSVWSLTAAPSLTTGVSTITTAVQRSDGSGTEEVFAKYLGFTSSLDAAYTPATVTNVGAAGNEGVLSKVAATSNSIGFVDWGYVASNKPTTVTVCQVDGFTASAANIQNALKGQTTYVDKLTKTLWFVTNGAPSQSVQDFITYSASPAGAASFDAAGMFGVTEFA